MAKVADVKLTWTKSVSADIERVEIRVTQNGTETLTELGPEVEQFMIEAGPHASVAFAIDTYDAEGNKATSQVYTFTLGDLEMPLAATNLSHEITAIRDTEEPGTG